MSVTTYSSHDRQLGVPLFLLTLALLALLVSLLGLMRTTAIADERITDLQNIWESVQDGSGENSELNVNNRLMLRVQVSMPVVKNFVRWSVGLAVTSLVLLIWLVLVARRAPPASAQRDGDQENTERAAVITLLNEIAPLANGDLRVRATVTDTPTGSLAGAFNYAVSELRWLVGSVGNSAKQVNESANRSRQSAQRVVSACLEQSHQIHQSSNFLLSMSGTMAELSADAAESTVAARAAIEKSEVGVCVLSSNLNQLSAMREEANSTTRLLHRLGSNVAAIEERMVVVQEAAKHTELLALNTTIRATGGIRSVPKSDTAAELGHLSSEVAQLAEILVHATRDISSLTGTISQDVIEGVQSMEKIEAEIATSVLHTQQGSEALGSIQVDASTLRERISAMSARTVEQSGLVRRLSENMDHINRITGQTAEAVTASAESLDYLHELAVELKQSLEGFKMPTQAFIREESATASTAVRKIVNRPVIHE